MARSRSSFSLFIFRLISMVYTRFHTAVRSDFSLLALRYVYFKFCKNSRFEPRQFRRNIIIHHV